jgi:hypothetical protein
MNLIILVDVKSWILESGEGSLNLPFFVSYAHVAECHVSMGTPRWLMAEKVRVSLYIFGGTRRRYLGTHGDEIMLPESQHEIFVGLNIGIHS